MKRLWNRRSFFGITRKGLVAVMILSLAAAPAGLVQAAPEAGQEEVEIDAQEDLALPDSGSESSGAIDPDLAVPGEIIVVYDDAGVTDKKSEQIQEQAEEALSDMDAEITEEIAEAGDQQGTAVVAEIPEELELEEAIERIEEDENVSFAQPNFIYSTLGEAEVAEVVMDPQAETNDATYNKYRQEYSDYLRYTRVYDAWDTSKTKNSVTVAVLDSGCRLDHEDLKNNILKEYAYDAYYSRPLTADNAPNGGDSSGHGTHVCGLIAAEADNGVGVAGTSYNANILPIKIFNNYGGGATTATFMRGIEYCRQLIDSGKIDNLRIMNMSVGYYSDGTKKSVDVLLENTIEIMRDYYNVLCVCSGGNGDNRSTPYTDPMYPSDFDNCLSVTALDSDFYNCEWSDYNEWKDISAPGQDIISTYYSGNNSYARLNGTSMAAPIVSGICALLWAKYPSLTADQVVEAVEVTANSDIIQYRADNTDLDRKNYTGSHGAVDAYEALNHVAGKTTEKGGNNINNAEISGIEASYEYTGGKIRPEPVIMVSGSRLKLNSDYTVSYSNNTNVTSVGTKASITIKGIGRYNGTVVKEFAITPKNIAKCSISLAGTSYAYTGKARNPAVTVKVSSQNSVQLKKGEEYSVTYSDNVEPGTATVTIQATGNNYTGSVVKKYTITKADVSTLATSLSKSVYTYNKKARKPSVTVKNGETALAVGKDYTVSYAGNVKPGKATVTVTGKGSRYTGTVTKTFTINPKGTSLSKLTKKSKGFQAKWKKQTAQTTGYQIQYSTSKNFGSAKKKTVKKANTTTVSVSGLKKGKVYYVRIRTYKKSGGKNYYSDWSGVKKVKTK